MKKSEKLYPFGFLFIKDEINELKVPEYYICQNINDKYYFYYDKANDHHFYELDDKFVIINGHYKHIGIEKTFENDELAKILLTNYYDNKESFLDILDFLAGRFVIIVGDTKDVEVYHDASGTRSVYYLKDKDAVSSHLYLLKDNFETNEFPKLPDNKNNFYMLDSTPLESGRQLLPNHSLTLSNKLQTRFFPRTKNKYAKWSENARFELAEKLWKNQLNYYSEKYEKLILSLTGGYDSRVLLAMSKEHADEIKYFTYGINKIKKNNYFEKVAKLDEYLVSQMVSDLKINHEYLKIDEAELSVTDYEHSVLDRNTVKRHGRLLLPLYNNFFPEENIIHVRGNLLEIGRFIFFEGTHSNARIKKHLLRVLKKQNKNNLEVFSKYLDKSIEVFNYNKPFLGYDQLDLFYWEFHMGKWYSELLNETDSAFNTVTPFNMRAIIDISLSFPTPQRINNYFFNELINRNYPVLNFYGKNDKTNLYEKYKQVNKSSILTNSYFNDIKLYNSKNQLSKVIKNYDNKIYIPRNFLLTENYAEVKFNIISEECMLDLSIFSKYKAESAEGYLRYEILKNNKVILTEDMSKWNIANNINIFNLKNNDEISIRVCSMRDIQRESWENASILEVLNYREIPIKKEYSNSVRCTSPYSVIY